MIRNEDIDDGAVYQKLHKTCCFPWCCSIACNCLFKKTRYAVSGKKKRTLIKEEGFDLDLIYLTDRIIVHGFPAMGIEHMYRNPRHEIKRFMDFYHKDHYKQFNFCCEPGRGYDHSFFHNRVERYPFKDHNTPPLETLCEFANSAKKWMDDDPKNVCNMHCKAGKGRAGLMSCVLLIRSGECQNAQEALDKYDLERVTNKKGLTVCSQRKYVLFYELLWRRWWKQDGNIGDIPGEPVDSSKWKVPEQPEFNVFGVEILGLPNNSGVNNVRIKIFNGTNGLPILKYDSGKGTGDSLIFDTNCSVQGNFKIQVDQGKTFKCVKLFELWHNTLFMDPEAPSIDFPLDQIDIKKRTKAKIGMNGLTIRMKFFSSEKSDASNRERMDGSEY
jgi:phosphatidylinositol-3,4,5-trisphosphate 3-phosphatase/dual-specificity protein phosphatase PTEN